MNEANTCRKYVVPKLVGVGWDSDPHSIDEQYAFTDGRIVVTGNQVKRRVGKFADYLLRFTRNYAIAVVVYSKPRNMRKSSASNSPTLQMVSALLSLTIQRGKCGNSTPFPLQENYGQGFMGLKKGKEAVRPTRQFYGRTMESPEKPHGTIRKLPSTKLFKRWLRAAAVFC
jgi:hypothetical protein